MAIDTLANVKAALLVSGSTDDAVLTQLMDAADGFVAEHTGRAFAGGAFTVKGSPGSSKTIQELALASFAAHDLPDGVEPGLDSDATFDPENFSYPHGTHLCATEVDT